MKHLIILLPMVLVLLIVTLMLSKVPTFAQLGGGYDLTWNTIDGGGGSSSGSGYSLNSTIGQPDAGALSGGGYTLNGGFWGGAALNNNIYLPLVVKGY